MHNSNSSDSTSEEEEFVPKKRKHVSFWEEYTEEVVDNKFGNSSTRNEDRFVDLPRPVNFVKSSTEEKIDDKAVSDEIPQSTSAVEKNNEQTVTEVSVSEDSEAGEEEEETFWTEPGFLKRQQRNSFSSLPKNFGVVRKVKSEYLFASNNRNRNLSAHESSDTSQGTHNQLGSWEKYTKGFGSKMLQKMGFTGRLGAYEQGLSKPLEPKVRPKNLGLAADGFQEKTSSVSNNSLSSAVKTKQSKVVSNEKTEKLLMSDKKRWKKRVCVENRVLETNRESTHTLDDVIIDMRGSEKRSLNHITEALPAVEQLHETNSETFLPELHYNIRILKDLTKSDLEQSSEQLKVEQRRLISLRSDLNTLEGRYEDLKEKRTILESFLGLIKEMDSSISLHDLISIVRQALEQYREECFKTSDILDALTACAQRHLNEYLGKEHYWRPTIPDRQWIQDVSDLGNMLGGRDESKMYSQLLWNTVVLRIKRHVASTNFNAQQPHDLVSFIEKCCRVFPEALIENVAADIVYPRLRQEVEGDWELSENIMPHHWIFPWLPLIGKRRVSHLFDYMWRRIGKCIRNWHPSKSFAREVVEPWLQIAKKNSLSKLFHHYVIPRLEATLKDELTIDIPDKESLESTSEAFSVFYWIISWYGILENEALAGILLKSFFPVWLETLVRWLSLQDVDWERVTIWYDLWKQKFPVEIQRMNNVRRAFDIALDIMNRAMTGEDTENMDIHRLLLATQVFKEEESLVSSTSRRRKVYDMPISSFKDLVGFFAERNGITLLPCNNSNRLEEPMYLFGDIPIRLDHQQQVAH
ncbi:uncharacterized protein Gasu_43330 [Galdieria sulphuraria]|uniref:G-patch domain-containing protein n=1 Tax=Galdieria sulphuraria TaxID=130081 RepID=M2XDU2_GALSU|nr:uncharacterized protein Gasu_43330 [Galdieria sulphuraria]EME28167.1 hypothetical protein Gasu_43330 [Galdieria sulphuraria]|eukprot:XP_005704687.1 hypothetical protein Gasu_43330 [Galdieria sulphuraria]